MLRRILVCLDGSELAAQILPYAVEQTKCCKSQLILLQVVSPIPTESVSVASAYASAEKVAKEIEQEEKEIGKEEAETRAYLERVACSLRKKGLDAESVVVRGTAGEATVSYADKNDIDLIALAKHGRSGLGSAIFGSVANYVLRESGLPILLVKPR
jgi:nucleotide-binding universal stress UspA family protein